MKLSWHRTALLLGYLAGLGTVAYYAMKGLPYYLTPLIERPRHELYWVLKPGGELGHRFGVIGTAMMVLMLGYSLRKRIPFLRRMGPMSAWLDYHILLGICGPLFILLHSSFKVQGLVALSFWSMVAVSVSGVLGRFLYRQIPRTQAGTELSAEEVRDLDQRWTRELTEDLGMPTAKLQELRAIAEEGVEPSRSLLWILGRMPIDLLWLRWRLSRFLRHSEGLTPKLRRRIARVARNKAVLHRQQILWLKIRELFHYWHVLHKPFAIIMYLFMVIHIAVAWMTGYGWSGG
ncbi:MAG: hypothetical protein K0U98_18305 [Deltaproteobacteria bacterium]|nr:hypothetical protein [Deltaproteobacteria bacterium]